MEMQQVRYFLAVAKTLNFTRAAEQCHVTQPALTRAIKQLEDELGGELIRREGRLSHLTDLGARMLPLLTQCYESALNAKTLAAQVKKGDVSTLAIGVSRTLDIHLLIDAFSEMQRNFTGLQLKMKRGHGAQIAEWLKSGEIELALGGPLGETWDRLESWPMFTESFDFVVAADHELAPHGDMDIDVELIRDARFLVHGECDPAELNRSRLDEAGINLDTAHYVDCGRDLEAMVSARLGVAIVPASTLKVPRIRHVRCASLDLRRTVAIYSIAGRVRSREAAALLNLIRAADWSEAATVSVETAEMV